MKILYDHQAFTKQYFGGVSKCFCELVARLPEDVDYEICIKQSNNVHLVNSDLVHQISPVGIDKQLFLNSVNIPGKYQLWNYILMKVPFFRPAEKINEDYSISRLKSNDWDIFHPTFFDPYFLPYLHGRPYVLTIHDMISELYPNLKLSNQHKNKKELVKSAAALIAVSENTKKDLCTFFDVPEEKVQVIYHGGPVIHKNNEAPIISGNYFLFVGNRSGYKRFDKAVEAFSIFHNTHKDYKLVCTGNLFTKEEGNFIAKHKISNFIYHLRASDCQMKNLYSNASAFIFPSEYEGFGMPILEAWSCGCPVLINAKSCFPEIAGNAAVYFNTDDVGSIVSAMEKISNSFPDQRNNLINSGYCRLSLFSWKKSAEKLAKIYCSIE